MAPKTRRAHALSATSPHSRAAKKTKIHADAPGPQAVVGKTETAQALEEAPGEAPGEAPEERQYFLIKSEPESRIDPRTQTEQKFSIDDLAACEAQTSLWDGVRNYQARNILKSMRIDDRALFYHSNCKTPGVVGTALVVREHYSDPTQFDPKDAHFDPKSKPDDPRWVAVDVKFLTKFKRLVGLHEIKTHPELAAMQLVNRGRLSVQIVEKEAFDFIVKLGNAGDEDDN